MNDMNNENYREEPVYQTGNTQPPKKYRGILCAVLAFIIFGLGIWGILGGVKLLTYQRDSGDRALSFLNTVSTEPTQAPIPENSSSLTLEPAQDGIANVPQTGGLSLQEIYEKNIQSVVSISCTGGYTPSSGTGVVFSEDGYLVTNYHVVESASNIQAQFTDGSVLPATLVGFDAATDLAILQVATQDLSPAQFGDSAALRVGDCVVAIGDPLGVELRGTMTNGIVSAINRDIVRNGRKMTLIQTNAALNPGNSGGPLINCYGQVVGINTMKIGDNVTASGVEGLGFAIPSTTVKEIVDQLLSQGYVSGRPSLGFTGETVSSIWQIYYRIPQGVYINRVTPGSSAQQNGILEGDVLVSFGDYRVRDVETLTSLLASHSAGEEVTVGIYRGGRQYSVTLVLGQAQ